MQLTIRYKDRYLNFSVVSHFEKGTPQTYLYPGDSDELIIDEVYYISEMQGESDIDIWDFLNDEIHDKIYDELQKWAELWN